MPRSTAELTPDLSLTRKFLRLLDPTAEAFTFQTFSDRDELKRVEEFYSLADTRRVQRGEKVRPKKRKVDPLARILHRPINEAAEELQGLNAKGAGVFITVNETDGAGRAIANFVRSRAVWADMDVKSDANTKPTWPLEPSIVVESSPGNFHYYWLVDGNLSISEHRGISERIVADYGADRKAIDPVRVLRLPGFYHRKSDALLSRIVDAKGHRYTAEELADAFPPIVREVRRVERSEGDIANDLSDVELALDYLADVPVSDSPGALTHVDDRAEWVRFGLAIKRDFGDDGFAVWDDWSKQSSKYDEADTHATWLSFQVDEENGEPVHVETIFKRAREAGWRPSSVSHDFRSAYAEAWNAAKAAGLHGNKATVRAIEKSATATESDPPPERLEAVPEPSALEWATKKSQEMVAANRGWTDAEKSELLTRMNADHAVVDYGSKVLYSRPGFDAEGRPTTEFMSFENMQKRFAAIAVAGSPQHPKTAFDVWHRWSGRKHYTGVGMFPGSAKHRSKCPKGFLNLWGGLQVTPQKGDWKLVKRHMRDVICEGNEEAYNWWMDWQAQLIQQPQSKPPTSIVLRSAERGTGKSMFGQFWRQIFGQHVVPIANIEQITGRFNSAVAEAVLAMCEETCWGGARTDGNVLRERISGTVTTIERKGLDPISQPSFTRYWLNANDAWIVPAGVDERRFMVLDFKFDRPHDARYFNPIWRQMLDEGGVAAMAHELLSREITADIRCPPTTKGLLTQREYSLGGLHRWLLQVARSGEIEKSSEFHNMHVLNRDTNTTVPATDVQEAASKACDKFEVKGLQTALGTLMSELGIGKARLSLRGKRAYVYEFPPLLEFQARVSKALNLPIADDADLKSSDDDRL